MSQDILLHIFKGQKLTKIKLHNLVIIRTSESIDLLSMFLEIWKKQIYTPKGYEIKPDDIVIDIGANIGIFSLFAASRTKNKVYSFEPFPDNFNILKQNVIDSCMKNVCCFNYAVSSSSGKQKLYKSKCDAGHSLFDTTKEGHLDQYIEVESKTLKQIFDENNIKKCAFLKMDCEGCEFEVIFKTPKEYLNRIEKISMEFHDNVSILLNGRNCAFY
ncbi:putative Methyltransferase FkbM family [groundwater metagenome]|uniref:Putative Methyltransferase FkbM family n=1 Tax=groundwater metagenome TaxID=717931 RepID=A0A098EEL6_9ZZZZ